MYERLSEQRWAVYAVLHDESVTTPNYAYLDLKADQWDLLSQLVLVLKPLQVATTALCKDENISSSLIHPVINGLVKHHLKDSGSDVATVKRFKEVVTGQLLQRFPFQSEGIAALSAALDPRHHNLNVFTTEEQKVVNTVIAGKVEELYKEDFPEPGVKKRKKETVMSFLLGIESDSDSTTTCTWKNEIYQFQIEPQAHHDSDPLVWWKTNEKRFPTLTILARRYLCVPATSVPAERIFSAAGLIITSLRSSLTADNADMLIFLNKNM